MKFINNSFSEEIDLQQIAKSLFFRDISRT